MSIVKNDVLCLQNSSSKLSCFPCLNKHSCHSITIYYGIISFQSLFCEMTSITIGFLLIIFLLSSLLNFFSIGTFSQRKARETGGGIYRLWISIIGQTTLTIFLLHLILEKLSQHSILGCYLFEYLHKCLHALYDSLTACTTIERTIVIYQGITFNKIASRRVAKLVIPILIIYYFISTLYEPFYREIYRSWCILKSLNFLLRNYRTMTNILYFLIPYLINFILPLFWIFALTKHKSNLYPNKSYWQNVRKAFYSNRHTFIPNCVLILFNTPRLISIFYFTCIQQSWQKMIYTMAYFISLIPLMINLVIFVLPSPKYRPELRHFLQHMLKYRCRS